MTLPNSVQTGDPGHVEHHNAIKALLDERITAATASATFAALTASQTLTGTQTVTPAAASGVGLVVKAVASQSGDLTQWQSSAGTVLTKVRNDGYIFAPGMGEATDTGPFLNAGSAGMTATNRGAAANVPFAVKGMASQSGDLQQWQNSAGTVLAQVTAGGQLWAEKVRVSEAQAVAFTGTDHYKARLTPQNSGTVWTLAQTVGDAPAAVMLAVKGQSSQTGDLTQWQDSAGTVLAKIAADGEYERITAGGGIVLKSPNGTRYRVTVADGGALTTTAA